MHTETHHTSKIINPAVTVAATAIFSQDQVSKTHYTPFDFSHLVREEIKVFFFLVLTT